MFGTQLFPERLLGPGASHSGLDRVPLREALSGDGSAERPHCHCLFPPAWRLTWSGLLPRPARHHLHLASHPLSPDCTVIGGHLAPGDAGLGPEAGAEWSPGLRGPRLGAWRGFLLLAFQAHLSTSGLRCFSQCPHSGSFFKSRLLGTGFTAAEPCTSG